MIAACFFGHELSWFSHEFHHELFFSPRISLIECECCVRNLNSWIIYGNLWLKELHACCMGAVTNYRELSRNFTMYLFVWFEWFVFNTPPLISLIECECCVRNLNSWIIYGNSWLKELHACCMGAVTNYRKLSVNYITNWNYE